MVCVDVCVLIGSVGAVFAFFFSSRRRHTSWPRDWSSDVCSSDLVYDRADKVLEIDWRSIMAIAGVPATAWEMARSEERREGKSVDLGGPGNSKKKKTRTKQYYRSRRLATSTAARASTHLPIPSES